MNAVESGVVQRRLLSMRDLVAHLKSLGSVDAQRLREDLGLRLQVSMALAQIVTLATEINSHVVARTTGQAPGDLRDSFTRMAQIGWLIRKWKVTTRVLGCEVRVRGQAAAGLRLTV